MQKYHIGQKEQARVECLRLEASVSPDCKNHSVDNKQALFFERHEAGPDMRLDGRGDHVELGFEREFGFKLDVITAWLSAHEPGAVIY